MSRIVLPALDTATGATAEIYAQIKKVVGRVPNAYATIGAHAPALLKAVLVTDDVLAAGSLSKQDQETIRLAVSTVAECDYCVAAHSLIGKMTGLSPDTLRQIRAGQPTGDARRDALIHFARLLTTTTGTIAAEDFDAIKTAGFSDRQLVEISLTIALIVFTNVFNRINDTVVDFPAID